MKLMTCSKRGVKIHLTPEETRSEAGRLATRWSNRYKSGHATNKWTAAIGANDEPKLDSSERTAFSMAVFLCAWYCHTLSNENSGLESSSVDDILSGLRRSVNDQSEILQKLYANCTVGAYEIFDGFDPLRLPKATPLTSVQEAALLLIKNAFKRRIVSDIYKILDRCDVPAATLSILQQIPEIKERKYTIREGKDESDLFAREIEIKNIHEVSFMDRLKSALDWILSLFIHRT